MKKMILSIALICMPLIANADGLYAMGIQAHNWLGLDNEQKDAVVEIALNYFIALSTSMATVTERNEVFDRLGSCASKLKRATQAYYSVHPVVAPYLKFMHDWLLEYLLSDPHFNFHPMIERNGVHEMDPRLSPL